MANAFRWIDSSRAMLEIVLLVGRRVHFGGADIAMNRVLVIETVTG